MLRTRKVRSLMRVVIMVVDLIYSDHQSPESDSNYNLIKSKVLLYPKSDKSDKYFAQLYF